MLLDDCYISYLNLDHRLDRLMLLETQFKKHGIVAERTRGMRPHEYDLTESRYRRMVLRTAGAVGCYEGQLSIMDKARKLGKHACVFEDDLEICSDFNERIAHIEKFTKTHEWDIIWLGGTFHVGPPWWHKKGHSADLQLCFCNLEKDAECTDDPRMIRTYGAFCTYAYIVNKDSLHNVIAKMEDMMPYSMGIDWSMIWLQPDIKAFAFVPGCIKQRDNMSDIGNGMTIFSGFAKLGPYWWQDKMSDFDPATFDWKEAKNNI